MKFNEIKSSLCMGLNKFGFWAKKNSPTILVVTGIVGAAASVILACKETTKVEGIVKESNEKIAEVKNKMNDDNLLANKEYSEKDGKKDLTKEYLKLGLKVTKNYLPSIALFSLSMTSILTSHKILKGRNLALAAAYSAVDNSFRSYRNRVKNKFGDEVEKEIFNNVYEDKTVVTKKNKNGEEIEKEETMKIAHPACEDDIYRLVYNEACNGWTKDGASNISYLQYLENQLNAKLRAQGYLFLKDVYDELGVEKGWLTDKQILASRVVGWIYDTNDPTRDNWVSFGIDDREGNLNKETAALRRRNERNIWLEFNPDGDILTNSKCNFVKYAKVI